jgi:AcrR family transcriptional regulator
MVYLVLKFKSAIDITTKMQYILTKVKYFNIVKIRGMMKLTKKEWTQKKIIEAGKYIIHEKGYEAITTRYLAEVSGYSHTNLYYYFKDINTLLWELRIDMIEDMIKELTGISYEKTDPIEEIIEDLFGYISYFFKHPNVFRFFYFYPFIQPEADVSYKNLEQKFNGLWQKSFIKVTQEGIVKIEDMQIIAKTIIYSLQGMIMLSFSSSGITKEDNIKDELVKLIYYLFEINKNH